MSDPSPRPNLAGVQGVAWPGTSPQIIRCTADRTLLVRLSADRAGLELIKVYERGSIEEARTEAGIGARLQVPGIVRYRDVHRDPVSGRPCVVMDFHPGVDAEHWLIREGPFSPRVALRIATQLARTLTRLHATVTPEAPLGVVHRDVKPANVLLLGDPVVPATAEALLLDLEHAVPAANTRGPATAVFTGGSYNYSPPEAYKGTAPTTAFDAFGLGATLHAFLCGSAPMQLRQGRRPSAMRRRQHSALLGQPRAVRALIDDCLHPQPEQRPSLAQVASRLEELAGQAAVDPHAALLDDAIAALQREDLDAAAALLAQAGDRSDGRSHDVAGALRRARRLRARFVAPPAALPDALEPRATAIRAGIDALHAWWTRFPASPWANTRRRQLSAALQELLVDAPKAVTTLKHQAQFAEARALLAATQAAVVAHEKLPGSIPPSDRLGAMPTPMQRDPRRYLQLAEQDVLEAGRTHEALVKRLEEAETQLDLLHAEHVVQSAAEVYGGASVVVAGLKDRTHRLGFYLERIAVPLPDLGELRAQAEMVGSNHDLDALLEFQRRCAERSVTQRAANLRGSSLRVLQRSLHDLVQEFPHIGDAVRATAALDQAMQAVTDQCWAWVEDAYRKLGAVPIPIRPLQSIIHRIDTLRLLEALVDHQRGTRAALLDELERLRLRVDQARTTRDRLARGAEEAMQRGHLTTAVYDMERALGSVKDETGELDANHVNLQQQLEETRRRKSAVEEAAMRSQELALKYAELEEDPNSERAQRITLLEQRRQVLRFLCGSLPQERVEAYTLDLDAVEQSLAAETNAQPTAAASAPPAHGAVQRRWVALAALVALASVAWLILGRGSLEPSDLLARSIQDQLNARDADAGTRRALDALAAGQQQAPELRPIVAAAQGLSDVLGRVQLMPAVAAWCQELETKLQDFDAALARTHDHTQASAQAGLIVALTRLGQRAHALGLQQAVGLTKTADDRRTVCALAHGLAALSRIKLDPDEASAILDRLPQ